MSTAPEHSAETIIVVGAGAAGQMAALAAAQLGRRVVLLEQMDRPGLKLLATGGSRCNITRMLPTEDFFQAFGRQGRFMSSAFKTMGPAALCDFMRALSVPTVVQDDRCVFPASQRALDVQNAFQRRIEALAGTYRTRCRAEALVLDAGRLVGVQTSQGIVTASSVVLACGGKSWPRLGGTGGGYALARQAGHSIIEPLPALVPLMTRDRWPSRLAGVSLPDVRIRIALPRRPKSPDTGIILFTHRGLSGPAVLDLSGRVSELLQQQPVPLELELIAGVDARQWARRLDEARASADLGRRTIKSLLQQYLPASLIAELCRLAGVDGASTAAHLPAAGRDKLAQCLGACPLTVTGTEGFETAFVTRGGVKLSEVDPDTLASRCLPGLYFAGELLDLDGPCGGYNLQWAFASGFLAGTSAATARLG